jgi:hypothetical protein
MILGELRPYEGVIDEVLYSKVPDATPGYQFLFPPSQSQRVFINYSHDTRQLDVAYQF